MNEAHLNKRYSSFVVSLLLLFPILINSVKISGNFILLILVFLGAYIAINEKKNPFKIQELKVFSWLTFGYFCVMLLSVLIADGFNAEFHHLGRKVHFLLAPLIALAIYQMNLPLKSLLLAIKAGLIIIGIIVIVQFLLGVTRPSGMINANIFSDITVAMLFLSIVQIFNEKPKEQIITFIAVLAGLVAIVLSSSRGSWLSFIILSICYIYFIYKPFLKGKKKRQLFLMSFFVILFSLVGTQSNVSSKIDAAVTNIQEWDNGSHQFSSSGVRLEMWRAGLISLKESPWFGYGYRNANSAASEYAVHSQEMIAKFTHLHNEYITSLVSAGIVGLLALLALLLIPLKIFLNSLKQDEKRFYSLMGMMLCVGYISFGFTHIALGEEHINAFYVLFMSFLLPRAKC
jgi:O-antigen ligase